MDSKPILNSFDDNPFIAIRGRKVLAIVFSTLIASIIVIAFLWPGIWTKDHWADISISILWCGLTIWILNMLVSRARLNILHLIGRIPNRAEILRSVIWAIPLVLLSMGCVWLIYLPLSYAYPSFVQYWLIEDPIALIWTDGPFVGFANLINFALVVIIVPIIEEFVFRGLLISRWSIKWGVPRAILVSSIIFGLLHVDIIGGILFGYVMAILYIKTKSLIIPMVVHGANNLIAWLLTLLETVSQSPMTEYTLNDFKSEWWIGALGLIIGIPWILRLMIAHWPKSSWRMPYFA